MTYTILVVVQVVIALVMIGLILVQHGKGADAGAAFGSGASGTVFGAQGSANFMSRATGVLAAIFFVVSLALAYLINGNTAPTNDSVTAQLQQPAQTAPARSDAATPTDSSTPDKTAADQPGMQSAKDDQAESKQAGDDSGVTAKIPE